MGRSGVEGCGVMVLVIVVLLRALQLGVVLVRIVGKRGNLDAGQVLMLLFART